MSGIPAGAGSLLGKRLGKYEILALLALGGTAEIYLARIGGAAGFEKYVVVKCLHDHLADDPEFVKMFLDEARLAACLDHSNIVQTMELGEHENRYFMVMEFLAGLSLAMIVRRAGERLPGGRIPVQLVLNMVAQSCAGLHYAHERQANGKPLNIVHRDISPQNLVISFEGVVKVVDFGIAKAELRETKTRSGTIKGKFAYMSPEQCVATNVDRRTDVFALGIIAHELLTGRRLFKRASPYETYQAVIECAIEPPSKLNPEIDPEIDPIIMRAVAKAKEDRYPTAEAFGDALAGYLHHRGRGSGPGDVSRFFDASFAQEIDEHGARMRELISGREVPVIGWGSEEDEKRRAEDDEERRRAEDEEDRRSNQTVDLGARRSDLSVDTADLMIERQSSLSDVIADLAPSGDDDDMPAERTRIEQNPLEKLKELDRVQVTARTGHTPAPQLVKPGAKPAAPGKTPPPVLRPQAHPMPPSGPLPLPAPPTGPYAAPAGASAAQAKPPSGKFPELANLPTMIADDTPPPGASPGSERARAERGGADVDGDGETVLQSERGGFEPAANAAKAPNAANAAHDAMDMPRGAHAPAGPLPPQARPSVDLPAGYPVMDAQLSAQVASGATVFPSQRPSHGPSRPPDSRPNPRVSDSGPYDPQRAADLASPVGDHYGDNVDWAAAAAAPARAFPPWMLALIFLAAIGVALGVTIVIAKLLR